MSDLPVVSEKARKILAWLSWAIALVIGVLGAFVVQAPDGSSTQKWLGVALAVLGVLGTAIKSGLVNPLNPGGGAK